MSSSRHYGLHRKKRLKHKLQSNGHNHHEMDRASSVSSLTESTMSLNIITVTLNMGTCFINNIFVLLFKLLSLT